MKKINFYMNIDETVRLHDFVMDIIDANITYISFNDRTTLSDDRVRISRDIYNFLNCTDADEG